MNNRRFEDALAQVCLQEGVSLIPYSPLGGGVLSGKYNNDGRPAGARTPRSSTPSPARRVASMPSAGRWPRIDGFPQILLDFETAGSLVRTVGDTILLDAILKGTGGRSLATNIALIKNNARLAAAIAGALVT